MNLFANQLARKSLVAITILLVIALFLPAYAQAAPERVKLEDADTSGETVRQSSLSLATKDGGRLILNTVLSNSGGDKDISLTKFSKVGQIVWTKTYGGSGDEEARSIQQTADEGFIITGYTTSKGLGGRDLYILYINKIGDMKWEAAAGDSFDDEGVMVQQMAGGDFVAVGYSTRQRTVEGSEVKTRDADIMAVRYDRNGRKLWQKYYGGEGDDYACSIQTNKSGGLVIAGCTRSYSEGTWDIYVIKMIDSGLVTWERSIGGVANYISTGIQQAPDNGYLVMGYTYDISSGERTEVRIRMDSSGTLLWYQKLDDQSLYGDAKGAFLTMTSDTDLTSNRDNALPPPQLPQPKQSRNVNHK
jgi:type II secretory pathway pseudopilin PulG